MKQLSRFTGSLALLICLASSVSAQPPEDFNRGFGVSPPSVSITVPPGGRGVAEFTLWNAGDVATEKYIVEISDLGQTDQGGVNPVARGFGTRSCVDWLTVPSEITIPASSSQSVRVEVTCPSSATGAYYAVLKIASPPPKNTKQGMSVAVRPTLGVSVEVVIPRPATTHLETDSIVYVPDEYGGFGEMVAWITNTGVWKKPIEGDLVILDNPGSFPQRLPFPYQSSGKPYVLYPSMTLRLSIPLTGFLSTGTHRVSTRLKLTATARAQKEFEIVVPENGEGGGVLKAQAGRKLELDANLVVTPDLIELTLPPGGSRLIPVKLTNHDNRALRIKAKIRLVRMEPNGMFTWGKKLPAGSQWLTVTPDEIELAPGRQITLRVRATIPKNAATKLPMLAAVRIDVATTTTKHHGDWASGGEFPVLVMAQAPKASVAKLKTTSLDLIRSTESQNPTAVVFRVSNDGDQIARSSGEIIVETSKGREVARLEIGKSQGELVFPHSEREFRMAIPPLDRGEYQVRARLSPGVGKGESAQSKLQFTAKIGLPTGLK